MDFGLPRSKVLFHRSFQMWPFIMWRSFDSCWLNRKSNSRVWEEEGKERVRNKSRRTKRNTQLKLGKRWIFIGRARKGWICVAKSNKYFIMHITPIIRASNMFHRVGFRKIQLATDFYSVILNNVAANAISYRSKRRKWTQKSIHEATTTTRKKIEIQWKMYTDFIAE